MNPHKNSSQAVPHDVEKILARARRGDRSVLPELRAVLDTCPEVWQTLGDLARHNCNVWVKLLAGNDLLAAESILRNLETMQRSLIGPSATPLEVLLAERIASTYMQCQHAEMTVAERAGSALPLANHLLRRADSANRRLAAAVRSLALVQRLLPRNPSSAADVPLIESAAPVATSPGGALTAKTAPKKHKARKAGGKNGRAPAKVAVCRAGRNGHEATVPSRVASSSRSTLAPALSHVNGAALMSGCSDGHDRPKSCVAPANHSNSKPANRLFGHLPDRFGTDGAIDLSTL